MTAAPADDSPAPRAVGRYLLFGEIAAGGMATVHFGRLSGAVGFARTVAIKRLHPQYAKDPEFVSMFLDEARLAGRIRHPNVVPMLDVVALSGSRPAQQEVFLVMEYVPGASLARLLKILEERDEKIALPILGAIMTNVLAGLQAAHETRDEHGKPLGIVHRDVSPQNVLVGTDGSARVLDFGVAKASGRVHTTREGQIKGKLAYMAPEQLSGGMVSRQTDVYAAGVVLWECLAGKKLHSGDNEAQVLVKVLEGRVPRISELRPEVPGAVDDIVSRALSQSPADRFESMREMSAEIERVLGLAPPSALGEWVESVAHEELAMRTAEVARLEAASSATFPIAEGMPSLEDPAPPASVVRRVNEAEASSSGVSSLSVSTPSGTVPAELPKRAWLYGAMGLAACAVAATVGYAITAPEPGSLPDVRVLSVIRAAPATTLLRGYLPPIEVAQVVPVSNPRAVPAVSASCNPPFRIDPVNGRKSYKLECLK